ncbi:MAG: heterodisulfide reductase-related iron-sulfur binding cluster [Gammaproteobacteria bacterium]|nr:heterodisulfide reductase-related iron-sulfur binding cluster [Gammaproteobacteria bacterium]
MARNDTSVSTEPESRSRILTELSDGCVKCGLCLPHCPTFTLCNNEAESPRGRIGLIQGLAQNAIRSSDTLGTHLEQCLSCRRCEAVCPAKVPYGRLIDAARATLTASGRKPKVSERLLVRLSTSRRLLHATGLAVAAWQTLKATRWLYPLLPSSLRRIAAMLPADNPRPQLPAFSAAIGRKRGKIALFTGCINPALEPQALDDSVLVLTEAGYDVAVPSTQVCCGALALHAGYPDAARLLIDQNLAAFDIQDVDAVVFTASGCGAMLREYDRLVDSKSARHFARSCHDVCYIVAASDWRAPGLNTDERIGIHESCTMKNVIGEQAGTAALLQAVAGNCTVPLPDNDTCCGSAGAYVVARPAIADALADRKLTAIRQSGVDIVATSNIGCALHLRSSLRRTGSRTGVIHPISLVARAIRAAASTSRPDL